MFSLFFQIFYDFTKIVFAGIVIAAVLRKDFTPDILITRGVIVVLSTLLAAVIFKLLSNRFDKK